MKVEVWFCENCGMIGAVEHPDKDDVLTVAHAIGDQHLYENACNTPLGKLRVIFPENIPGTCVLRKPVRVGRG